jgi:uncharacterized protein HemX
MLTRIALAMIFMVVALGYAGSAFGQNKVHSYLNETAMKVRATDDVTLKRELLSKDLATMTAALAKAEASPLTSAEDDRGLQSLQIMLQEKSDELSGAAGFERVADAQLDAFATYVVQDMEQADRTVNISLVSALLILIIVILLA